MENLVSIILLNYNNNNFTIDCLESLTKQTYRNFEVIVIDNGSKYSTYLKLKEKIETFSNKLDIKLIKSKYNLYYAGGNNKGMKLAKGEYFCLLNNDTEVREDFLEKTINFLKNNPKVGMLCPKITYFDKKDYIWYAGAYLNPRSIYFCYHIGVGKKDKGEYNKIEETAYANGAALFTSRDVVEEIGLLDDIFFIYAEETDWNYRAKKKGYKVIYFPETLVYHKVDRVTNRFSGLREKTNKMYLYNRNKIILMLKNFNITNIVFFFLGYYLKTLVMDALYSFKKNRIDYFIAQIRALIMGFLIGIKRRTNRKCKKLMMREFNFIQHVQKKTLELNRKR
ncbi:MAG: glycosyltransferase family 2 protein [Promethearchaeota archaeon]